MSGTAQRGFTLLELLLALSLGAALLALLSRVVAPVSHQLLALEPIDADGTRRRAERWLDEVEAVAADGALLYPLPHQVYLGQQHLGYTLRGTGGDMGRDTNGDNQAGYPLLPPLRRGPAPHANAIRPSDDDIDGATGEDPINGRDDDSDGLVDEDPELDADDSYLTHSEAGQLWVDDNRDGRIDGFDNRLRGRRPFPGPWQPQLPDTLNALNTEIAGPPDRDDDEDGYSDEEPLVVWSARFFADRIECASPSLTRDKSHRATLHRNTVHTCLSGVSSFSAIRHHFPNGTLSVLIELRMEGATEPLRRWIRSP